MSVVLETSVGDITVDLYTDERPRCCLNFLKLCKVKYYNFSLFHTVQKNLVAQTGDPTATGRGGESVFAKLYGEQARFFEMEVVPRIKHTKKGQLSMVNNGGNMHGSQFFITLRDGLTYLDGQHTVFGEVAEGFDILEKINNAFCDDDNRPYQDIRIYHTVILDDPYDDPEGLQVPDKSPGPTEEMLNSTRIAADEDIHKDDGMTEEELKEKEEAREAKANAQLLEMVGDLPDVDVKPPDNVLFVCKLNPVTGSDDLETIFSRFGPIKSCEVIKDQKTGESLQYAFIEFENEQDCESAYFKMDNVLIDDRRIHVDFSQSVSKLKWQKGGKKMEEKDEDRPKYVIKDQTRKQGNYELVFEDDDEADVASGEPRKKKKKHKERRAHSSGSDDERSHRHKEHKEKKKKKKQSRSRSRSRDRGHHSGSRDRGHRSRSRDRGPRRRSRSPEERGSGSRREKTRYEESGSHARDRRRERSPDSHRHKKDRERDRYR